MTPNPPPPARSNARTRVLSGLVLVGPVLLAVWMGGWAFAVLVVIILTLGAWEAMRLARAQGLRPLAPWVFIAAAGLPLVWQAGAQGPAHATAAAVALVLAGLASFIWLPDRAALPEWGVSLAVAAYVIAPGVAALALRASDQGLTWTLLAMLATWTTDTAAYVVGRAYGKHPFFARISPRKTREGALGGLIAGSAVGLVVGLAGHVTLSIPLLWLAALSAAAASQIGDLSESLLKRQAGIKDSGTLIPGHGGLLDRVDGLLFALVVIWIWRSLIG